jgi:hypothetical protein
MNEIFRWCVDFLVVLSDRLHMTYEQINIWIFVIIEPIVFFIMLFMIVRQRLTINRMRKKRVRIKLRE